MRRHTSSALVAAVLLTRVAGATPAIADMSVPERSTLDLITSGRTSGKPHGATIWFVYEEHPPRIYVQSGKAGQTDWYRNLLKTPAVTVKIDDRQFLGHAQPIDDAAETLRVHELFKRKYWTARIMSWFGGGFGAGKVILIDGLEPSP